MTNFAFLLCGIGWSQIDRHHNIVTLIDEADGNKIITPRIAVSDDNGFVWIASEMGMYLYDGNKISKVSSDQYPEVSGERIPIMVKNHQNGEIYFSCFPSSKWFLIKDCKISFIPQVEVAQYAIIAQVNLQFYSYKNPIIHKNLTSFHPFFDKNKNATSRKFFTATRLLETSDFLYIHCNNHLMTMNKKNFKSSSIDLMQNVPVIKLGNRVFIFEKNQFYELDNNIKKKYKKVDETVKLFLLSFSELYVNDSKLLLEVQDKNYITFNGKVYLLTLKNDIITAEFLFDQPEKNVFGIHYNRVLSTYVLICGYGKIAIIKPTQFNHVHFDNYKMDINYAVINPEPNELYSPNGWKYNFKDDKITIDTQTDSVNNSFILKYSGKYFIQKGGYIQNIKDKKDKFLIKHFNKFTGLYSGFCIQNKRLWLLQHGSQNKLFYVQNGKKYIDYYANHFLTKFESTNLYSINSKLLFTTTKGVFLYKPFTKKITSMKGLENIYARSIFPVSRNSFWLCCYGNGLYLIRNRIPFKVKQKGTNGFLSPHSVTKDAMGRIWISSNEGLFVGIEKDIIANVLKGKSCEFYRFSTKEGLLTDEFNGGSTNPYVNIDKKIIGFPNMSGFTWFRPANMHIDIFRKKIIINSVKTERGPVIKQKDKFVVPDNTDLVTVDFSYAYQSSRNNLVITYCLKKKKKWYTVTGNTIQIPRPGAGIDTLLIKIHTKTTQASQDVTEEIVLNYKYRYYETIGFWAFIFAVVLICMFLTFRIGLLLNRRKAQNLELKIREKTIALEENNKQLESSKEEISRSLLEKEILLREIHHRVKNNLQLVISLLDIQGRKNNYQTIEEFIKKGETRIIAMALIHENLYKEESIENLKVTTYIENLTKALLQSYEIDNDRITVMIRVGERTLNLQTAISFGLIVNELVTNSLKYAFEPNQNGIIKIELNSITSGKFELVVEDNGRGFNPEKINKKTFGLELIHLLVNQLNGTIEISNKRSTRFKITFSEVSI